MHIGHIIILVKNIGWTMVTVRDNINEFHSIATEVTSSSDSDHSMDAEPLNTVSDSSTMLSACMPYTA